MNDFVLIVTSAAEKYLKNILNHKNALKIDLKQSGCTGYSYVISTQEVENEDVSVFQGISFIVADKNQKFLNNSIIDYQKSGLNAKLIIDNPSVKNECGCGLSFSFKEVI